MKPELRGSDTSAVRVWRLFVALVGGAVLLAVFLKALPPIVLLLALVGGLAYWSHREKAGARAETVGSTATSLGLVATGERPATLELSFRLLSRGSERNVGDVMSGTWRGRGVEVFDFRYRSAESISGEEIRTFSCAVASLPGACPPVVIEPTVFLSTPSELAGLGFVETGSERLNRRFAVLSGDPSFASAILDERMRGWLLGLEDGFGFELAGRALLGYTPRVPRDTIELLDAVTDFADRLAPELIEGDPSPPAGLDAPPAEP